jgi:hypothetical protein
MSEYGAAERGRSEPAASTLSVPFLVLSALLCGLGLFGMAYWLVTQNWLYFASVIPIVLGAVMLFTRGTGPDHA